MGIPKLIPIVLLSPTHPLPPSTFTQFDSLIIVSPTFSSLSHFPFFSHLSSASTIDSTITKQTSLLIVDSKEGGAPGGRLIYSPTGPIHREYDDVRTFGDAARKGVDRAKVSGSKNPLVLITEIPDHFPNALSVSLLEILAGLYEPIQARESLGEDKIEPIESIGFVLSSSSSEGHSQYIVSLVEAIESGRRIARDLGSGDPERMTALRCAEYIHSVFQDSKSVSVEIKTDKEYIRKEYPLLFAVARASFEVERHRPCIVKLRYKGGESGQEEDKKNNDNLSLMFAGKGVTYDTGGADVKVAGGMTGMHMDKGGASAIVGFFKVVEKLQPGGVEVVAELGFVRNSIGAESYVADEIIVGKGGKRIMIGNSDAEGRMVLADCLAHLKEEEVESKKKGKNVYLFTCATLTGHAAIAMGPYPTIVESGKIKKEGIGKKLQEEGEKWGDPFEISTLRREDYKFVMGKSLVCDLLQCNKLPSSGTPRGHQFPAAFLICAAGLEDVKFGHLDIAGGASEGMDSQFGKPTGTPIVALTAAFLLERINRGF